MNKHLKQFGVSTLLCLAICSAKVFAGERGGNGGDAILCPDRVIMLDSHESSKVGPIVFAAESQSIKQKLSEALARLKSKDEILAEEISQRAQVFLDDILQYEIDDKPMQKNTEFTTDTLMNVADEGSASVPAGCRIEQLIIQKVKPFTGEKKYKVQSDLWKKMDSTERAIAVLHEAIYGYLLQQDVNNSTSTRLFNGFIVRDELKAMDQKAYVELIQDYEFPNHHMSNGTFIYFPTGDIRFGHDGSIEDVKAKLIKEVKLGTSQTQGLEAICKMGSQVEYVQKSYAFCSHAVVKINNRVLEGSLSFTPEGKIKQFSSVYPEAGVEVFKINLSADFQTVESVEYNSEKRDLKIGDEMYVYSKIFEPKKKTRGSYVHKLVFYPNGNLKLLDWMAGGNCDSLIGFSLKFPDGSKARFKQCYYYNISFSEDGSLLNIEQH